MQINRTPSRPIWFANCWLFEKEKLAGNHDPVEALNDLQNLLSRLIGGHIKLSIEHGPDIGNIRADRQFDQVIVNLVVNAWDAMPAAARSPLGRRRKSR